MEPIKSFEITGMTLSGFKCFADNTELTFGSPTVITGGNGRGKSSVADAIAFAITGLPFFGERGIDRLHAEDNPNLFIALRFTDETGAEHELTRLRQKSRMSITYDGREIRQADLTDLFGEKDVFLSIFNPLYFIEELGEDGRKLLERYLPEIPQGDVMALLAKPVQDALRSETIYSPESFLKKLREEIRELEKTSIYLTGQKDLSDKQRQEAMQKCETLTVSLQELEAENTALEERRFAGADASELRQQLVDLSSRYEEMAGEAPAVADTAEVEARLAELHQKLGQRSAEQYAPKYAQPLAETGAKVKELGLRYKREAAALKGFAAGTICPTCRRAVSEAELPAVRETLQQSLSEVVRMGREAKEQMEELNALEKKTEDTFRQFQTEDVQKLEEEIRSLNAQRAELSQKASDANAERKQEMDALLSQIRNLTAQTEYGALTPEECQRLEQCREELEFCRNEIAAARQIIDAADEDFDEKLEDTERQIAERKKKIANMALYVSKRAELLFSRLQMNRVQISLFDVVKSTGEVKDAFQFTYNGRRYDRLSLSEKIRAGMEVSELMKRLTGRNYPQYVDNMESVDDLANVKPTGQIIMAKCVKGTALSVRAPGQMQSMPKAA